MREVRQRNGPHGPLPKLRLGGDGCDKMNDKHFESERHRESLRAHQLREQRRKLVLILVLSALALVAWWLVRSQS